MALTTQKRIIPFAGFAKFLEYNKHLEVRIQQCVLETTDNFEKYDRAWNILDYLMTENAGNKQLRIVTTSGESLINDKLDIQYSLGHVAVVTSAMAFSTEEQANKYPKLTNKLVLAYNALFESYCFRLKILEQVDSLDIFERFETFSEQKRSSDTEICVQNFLGLSKWKDKPKFWENPSFGLAIPLYTEEKGILMSNASSPDDGFRVEHRFVLVPEKVNDSELNGMLWKLLNIRAKRQLECGLSECHKVAYALLGFLLNPLFERILGKRLSKSMIKSSVLFAVLNSDPSIWNTSNITKCLSLCSVYLLHFLKNKFCPHVFYPGCNLAKNKSVLKIYYVYLTKVVSEKLSFPSCQKLFNIGLMGVLSKRIFTTCELFRLEQFIRFETNRYCTTVMNQANFGEMNNKLQKVKKMLNKVCKIDEVSSMSKQHLYLIRSINVQYHTVASHIPLIVEASYDVSTKLKTCCILKNYEYTQNALELIEAIDCTNYRSYCATCYEFKTTATKSLNPYEFMNLCNRAYCVKFYIWDSESTPEPITYALHSSMHCLRNKMPVAVYFDHLLLYMKFVISNDCGKIEEREKAFDQLLHLAEDPCLIHKSVFWRLLGHCFQIKNQTQTAFEYYVAATCHTSRDCSDSACYWQATVLLWDFYFQRGCARMVFDEDVCRIHVFLTWPGTVRDLLDSLQSPNQCFAYCHNLGDIRAEPMPTKESFISYLCKMDLQKAITYCNRGHQIAKGDHTFTKIMWEIPSIHFPTFTYTLDDICEIMKSVKEQFDLCKSTTKLEGLCSQIEGMPATVRMVVLSTNTKTEDCILDTVTKHFESKAIFLKARGITLLNTFIEEHRNSPFQIPITCNKDLINAFQRENIVPHILLATDNQSHEKCATSQTILQPSTVTKLLDTVDDLLEKYFLSIFAQIVDSFIDECEDDERINETVRFANALYKRSGLPKDAYPSFKIGKITQVPMKIKQEIVEIDQVLGCGEEGGVFIIDIKKTDRKNDEKAEEMVKEILKQHGIEKYHIFLSEIERHARVEIQSGAACNMNKQSGTLGPFILESSRDQQQGENNVLYVLCAGHVVKEHNNAFLETQQKHIGKVSCNSDCMDIAKVRVEEDILKYIDVRFQNEADEKMVAKLYEKDPSDLEGRCVFLRGASTKLGRGKIKTSSYLSRDNKCKILIIEKRSDYFYYAERGDSGATVLFLDKTGTCLNAVGMHLSQLNRGDNQLVYQALLLEDGINRFMSRDADPILRLASSVEVEPHFHFTKLAVVEITRKYIRGVKSSAANIKDTETICTYGKEVVHLPDNLTPGEIVEKASLFVQTILSSGLHTILVIGTDVIDKATIVRKNTAECSGLTHTEAIGYSCTHNDTQSHVLLNVDDGKISLFTSLSSQQATNEDSFDVYNSIRSKCLKKLQKRYEIKQNDKRNDEIKNVEEQFERKLLTFNGSEDIDISVLDSRNVCDNAGPVHEMKVPKAVVLCILKKVCQEIENKVIDALKAHGFTRNAVFHVYGVLTLCPKLHEILPFTLGGNVTKCICVLELPKIVLHEAGKRFKCKCAIGLEGMRKQSIYIPWKESDSQ